MKQDTNKKFFKELSLVIIILFTISSLLAYFTKDYVLSPKRLSDETVNEYSSIAQSIWDGDGLYGLSGIEIKELKIKSKEGIDTSLMYTKGISFIDYSKVSVTIILKNGIVITQKNNSITIYLNDSNIFTHTQSNVIRVTFQNGKPKITKSSNEGRAINNITVWMSFMSLVMIYTFVSIILVLLLLIFRIWLCKKWQRAKNKKHLF